MPPSARTSPSIYIEKITFSGGAEITLNANSIFVLTGPNNSGKSALLKEIRDSFGNKSSGRVSQSIAVKVNFDFETYLAHIASLGATINRQAANERLELGSHFLYLSPLRDNWPSSLLDLSLSGIYFSYLPTETRLMLVGPDQRVDYPTQIRYALTSIRRLDTDEELEILVSDIFASAFKEDLIVNRGPGTKVHLHTGRREGLPPFSKANTREYSDQMRERPFLEEQGDGMRSFAGILLHTIVEPRSVILLDEPEAFLHPPQIRKLANVLARTLDSNTQLIISTHSEAFVQGLLEADKVGRAQVARIIRQGNTNHVTRLDNERISTLWSHSLLRHSDILSALFYQVAIVCEGDSDARFLQAMVDALSGERNHFPDLRFYHVNGKDRIHVAVGALRALNMPIVSVVDIDILKDRSAFRRLIEAAGGDFALLEANYDAVTRSVNQRKADTTVGDLRKAIDNILINLHNNKIVDRPLFKQLEAVIKESDRWRLLKQVGRSCLGSGEPIRSFDRLVETAGQFGILINVEGELEGFCRTISGENKSDWLAKVLERDLRNDLDLKEARDFVRALHKIMNEQLARSMAAGTSLS